MFAQLEAGDVDGHGVERAGNGGDGEGARDDDSSGGGGGGVAGGIALILRFEGMGTVKAIGQLSFGARPASTAAKRIGDESGDARGEDAGDADFAPADAMFGHAQEPDTDGQGNGEHDVRVVADELGDGAGRAFFEPHFFNDGIIGVAENEDENGTDGDGGENDPEAGPETPPAAAEDGEKFASEDFPAQTGGAFLFGRIQGE